MTTNQPDRIDRLEARIGNLVTATTNLLQTVEIHQQDIAQLTQSITQLAQLQVNSLQRIEDMLERFLRQSGNGKQGQ